LRRFALTNYNHRQHGWTSSPVLYWPQYMLEALQPILEDRRSENCPRCLQPIPPQASRCPACRLPIHSQRYVPFAIGIAGLLALLFVAFVMYRMARNEDAANAPVPIDEPQQQEILPDPPPSNTKQRAEPARPEKPPPLNEK
jgi:hypothetical protein